MPIALHEGAIFAGRYRVVGLIASGGMGAVYEVVHLETQRRRALKVMLPHVLQNADLRDRFKREARVAADVESEFIVDVFDAGVDEATQMPFLVMELLRGEELGKRLKRLGRLPPIEAVAYLHQTALALDKTHKASIVHRDLKPENIFLTAREDGPPRVKVLDFGVAKLVAEGVTAAGATEVVGTPTYMAPEQFRADSIVTPAADIYALGLMAYTLLVGVPYWKDEAASGAFAVAIVASRGTAEPATARASRRGVALPAAFDAWFSIATAVDARQRFPSASAAIRALADALGVASPVSTLDGPLSRRGANDASQSTPASGQIPSGSSGAGVPLQSAPMPSLALPAVTATLTPPMQARRKGLTILGVALGSLIGLAAGVWAWRESAQKRAETTPDPKAEPAVSASPVKPSIAPAGRAEAPIEVTSASADPSVNPAPKPSVEPSVQASARAVPKGISTPKPQKTAAPSKPSPVYSQE